MDFEYVISEEHNIYPNITVYDKYYNGVFAGWEMRANEGYVFYDMLANNTEIDPDTLVEIPVIYYYTIRSMSARYNWSLHDYEAVPRSEVDENYIFGTGNNNHETA